MAFKLVMEPLDVVKGKYCETLKAIEALYQESYNDARRGEVWSAATVYERVSTIKKAMETEMKQFAEDIVLE